jgi:trigger factor
MKAEVKQLPKSTVQLSITVTPEEMTRYFAEAAKQAGEQVNVKGFRKGKVPRSMLEAKLGKDYLAHQALELAVTHSYYQAVTKHQLRPIGRPKTDVKDEHKHLEEKGLSYTATVPVVPDVKLGDYKKVSVKPAASKFSDKLVEEAVDSIRKSRASTAQVTRAAKSGDRLEIDFVGKIDGKEFEGGKSENHPVVIGENTFIPGFEENLIGMKAKQVKTFKVKFPKDYRSADLAGKEAEFTVTLKQVQAVRLPELTDKFAEGFGAKSLLDLKTRLRENLQAEKAAEAQRQTELAVVDKVVDQAESEIPEALVDEELTGMLTEMKQQVERQGLPYDKYLEQLGKTEDDLRKEHRDQAKRRVKMSLVLNAIQQAEKLEPTAQSVKAEIDRQLAGATEAKDKERIRGEDFKRYVTRVLGNRMVIERLSDWATKPTTGK